MAPRARATGPGLCRTGPLGWHCLTLVESAAHWSNEKGHIGALRGRSWDRRGAALHIWASSGLQRGAGRQKPAGGSCTLCSGRIRDYANGCCWQRWVASCLLALCLAACQRGPDLNRQNCSFPLCTVYTDMRTLELWFSRLLEGPLSNLKQY